MKGDHNLMNMHIRKTDTFTENDIFIDGIKVGELELCPEQHEISRLTIYEPYQNKGYGSKVINDLVQQGYTKLWVRTDNEHAMHVYKKCGFSEAATRMIEMIKESEDNNENA